MTGEAVGDFNVLAQQIVNQGLDIKIDARTLGAEIVKYIRVEIDRDLDLFGGHEKLALFRVGEVVFIFHRFSLWQRHEEALINLGLTAQGTELPTAGTGRDGGEARRGRTGLGHHHLIAPARLIDDFGELGFGLVDIDLAHRGVWRLVNGDWLSVAARRFPVAITPSPWPSGLKHECSQSVNQTAEGTG